MAKPEKTFEVKGIQIALWKNDRGYSISVKKTYKDKASGAYKEAKTYFPDELATLITLLSETRDYLDRVSTGQRSFSKEYEQPPKQPEQVFIMPDPKPVQFGDDDIPF